MSVLTLGLALMSAVAAAAADDGCVLDLEAIRGQLDHTAEGVTTLEAPRRVDRQLTEAIRLSDGTEVRFQAGGCAHHGFSFSYSRIDLNDRSFASAAARAKALLSRTPVREADRGDVQMLVAALDAPYGTSAAPDEIYLDCGDAVCSLSIRPDDQGDTVTLTVSYSFPL